MNRLQRILPLAFLLSAWLPALDAGVLMVNTQEYFDGSRGPSTTRLHVQSDRVRVELDGQEQMDVIIFRGDKQTMWMLNKSERTYHEMTKADVERMSQQISGAMSEMQKRMQEQLKNMPPEQRKMVEQMMKSRMGSMPGAAQTSKTEYTKVASDETVNQWTCDKYEATRDGQKTRELWTVPPSELGFEASDFQVMRQMAEFFKSFTQLGQEAPFRVGLGDAAEEPDFSGVPVRQIYFDGGRPTSRSELKEVTRRDFDSSLFELPDGFKKKDMFGGKGNPFQR